MCTYLHSSLHLQRIHIHTDIHNPYHCNYTQHKDCRHHYMHLYVENRNIIH